MNRPNRKKFIIIWRRIQDHKCPYCGVSTSLKGKRPWSSSIDHIICRSKLGGVENNYWQVRKGGDIGNIIMCCHDCNVEKDTQSLEDFLYSRTQRIMDPDEVWREAYRCGIEYLKRIQTEYTHDRLKLIRLRELGRNMIGLKINSLTQVNEWIEANEKELNLAPIDEDLEFFISPVALDRVKL